MKVLLLTKYDQSGASSRYRTLQYLNYLKKNNIDVIVNSLLDNEYIKNIYSNKKPSKFYYLKQFTKRMVFLLQRRKFDLYWIEGELFPYLPFFIEKLFLPKNYVAEYDDAIFHNYNMHSRPIIQKLFGKKINKIMKNSQHVVVGNEYVKQYALASGSKKITIIPTVVNAEIYKPTLLKKETRKVVIGWLGSPTTVKYIHLIESVLINIAKKSDISFLVIGGEYKMNDIDVINHHWPDKWSEAEEIALLNQMDIGIMPLVDSPWEKGKCGFKLIKYMACGKPVIASPVSSNKEIVVHGENGYLAETLKDWEEYLSKLISNSLLRQQFGKIGRQIMMEKYSIQATAPTMCRILKEATN